MSVIAGHGEDGSRRMHRGVRLAATSEGDVVLGVELVDGLVVGRGSWLVRQWLRYLVLEVQSRVDTTLALRGSDEALVSTLGI